jgi:hypothetical protein
MPIASRLLSTGTLLVNGAFDEQTDNIVYNSTLTLYLNASKTSSYPGSGTAWTDLSGNNNNATLIGSPTFTSSGGGAIVFNPSGTGQSANVPVAAVPSGGSQVSVCCWINLGNPGTPPAASVFNCNDSAGNRIINIHLPWNDSIVYWDAGNSGGTYDRINTSTLTLAQKTGWHHWAFTKNASTGVMVIYLDGVSIASGTGKTLTLGTASTATVPCAIANFQGATNWNGSVSSFQIYNVALTAVQVSQIYTATSTPYTKFKTTVNAVYATEFNEVIYNPASTTANGGRINLSSYSNYFEYDGSLGWRNYFPAGATTTTGIDAPDGSLTAIRFSCNNTTAALLRSQITSFTPNGSSTYTMSFYARHVSGTKTSCSSDLADGVTFDYSSTLVTGSWVRITYSGVPTATAKNWIDLFSNANTNNVIDYWGTQIEQASSASIYQPIYNNIVTPPFAKRKGNTGILYVASQFDEFTGAPIVDSNLKLWLDAGQTASYVGSGTTWTDLSGAGNNGTLVNTPTYSSTTNGGTFTFNGTNTYASTTLSGVTDGTILAWHRATARPDVNPFCGIVDCDNPGSYGTGFGIDNSLYSTILDNQFWNTGVAVTLNQWQMAVLTFTATTATFYLNGTSSASLSYTRGAVAPSTVYNIGRNAANGLYYTGAISTVMIYDRALTADEILTNFNALRGRYSV